MSRLASPVRFLENLRVRLVSLTRRTPDCKRSWRSKITTTTVQTCSLDTPAVIWNHKSKLRLIQPIIKVVVATLRITSAPIVDSVITARDCATASRDTQASHATSRPSTSKRKKTPKTFFLFCFWSSSSSCSTAYLSSLSLYTSAYFSSRVTLMPRIFFH